MTQDDQINSDFRNFVFLLWGHLGLPSPTPIQYDIALYLQQGPRRKMVQAFRGVGKSWITAAFVLWRLRKNPNERILVVSANEDRATQFTTFCRRLIAEVPFLADLKPQDGHRDSVLAFDVGGSTPHQSPSLRAAGIFGQITGSRASLIVADDIEVPKNSLTQTMRDRLSEAVKEFDAVLMTAEDVKPLGLQAPEIDYLGTPQTEATIYTVLESRGYEIRIWPARYPDAARAGRYGSRLAPVLAEALLTDPTLATQCDGRGAPTDPTRFTDLDLMEREASYGRSGFALQFMLDPIFSDAERYPLKLADLIVMDLDAQMGPIKVVWSARADLARTDLPLVGLAGDRLFSPLYVSKENFVNYVGTIMAIDPSGRGGDELGYAVLSQLNGYLYLHRCRGLKGGYTDENLQKLADEAKAFGVNEVIIESNFGDGMFAKLLSPFLTRTHPCHIEEVRSSIQKEKRIIDTLEPVMNQHRLVVDATLIKEDAQNYNDYAHDHAHKYQLFYQMTRITRDKGSLAKDDRVDVLSIAVARWVQLMDKDTEATEQEHRAQLMEQEIEQFLSKAGVMGHGLTGDIGQDSTLSEFFD